MTDLRAIASDQAPAAIGPYSQAIVCDGWIYCSGQIALDPASGRFEGGDVAAQTTRVFSNLRAVLAAAGSDLGKVVKCQVYLASMDDFAAMNAVYESAFEGLTPPARACVEVARLPKDALVEIDCIARSAREENAG